MPKDILLDRKLKAEVSEIKSKYNTQRRLLDAAEKAEMSSVIERCVVNEHCVVYSQVAGDPAHCGTCGIYLDIET